MTDATATATATATAAAAMNAFNECYIFVIHLQLSI